MNEFQTLLKKYTNQHSRFLSVDGTLIHYRIEGEGEPLVLLHGAFSSLHTFEEWTKRLSKKYQIIRLDLPGFALTGSVPDDDYSMKRHLHYLNTFLENPRSKEILLRWKFFRWLGGMGICASLSQKSKKN